MDFLSELKNFSYKQVNCETYEKVRYFLIKEKIDCDKVKKVSPAAHKLCIWLLCMIKKIDLELNSIEGNE